MPLVSVQILNATTTVIHLRVTLTDQLKWPAPKCYGFIAQFVRAMHWPGLRRSRVPNPLKPELDFQASL